MTNQDEELSMAAIELCRKINRKAAEQYCQRGISPEDVALGSLYSTMDLATGLHSHNPRAAIEWLRAAVDELERQVADQSLAVLQ